MKSWRRTYFIAIFHFVVRFSFQSEYGLSEEQVAGKLYLSAKTKIQQICPKWKSKVNVLQLNVKNGIKKIEINYAVGLSGDSALLGGSTFYRKTVNLEENNTHSNVFIQRFISFSYFVMSCICFYAMHPVSSNFVSKLNCFVFRNLCVHKQRM